MKLDEIRVWLERARAAVANTSHATVPVDVDDLNNILAGLSLALDRVAALEAERARVVAELRKLSDGPTGLQVGKPISPATRMAYLLAADLVERGGPS